MKIHSSEALLDAAPSTRDTESMSVIASRMVVRRSRIAVGGTPGLCVR